MVQFSATAYSPRLVLWISRDPVISHSVGVFTATFLYALAALAWVDRNGSGRVPLVGMSVIAVLLILSIIMFISLIQRVSMLQVTRMLIFTGDQGREVIEKLYPPMDTPATPYSPSLLTAPCAQTLFHHGHLIALQRVDIPALVRVATEAACALDMTASVGDVVLESTPMLRVLGGPRPIPEEALRSAIELGAERTSIKTLSTPFASWWTSQFEHCLPRSMILLPQSRRSMKLKTCCSGSAAGGSKSELIATP